jgi:hypothetical protein
VGIHVKKSGFTLGVFKIVKMFDIFDLGEKYYGNGDFMIHIMAEKMSRYLNCKNIVKKQR